MYFANSQFFKETVYKLLDKRNKAPKYIIIHAANIHNIDSSGLHTLEDMYQDLKDKGVEILFSGMIGPVRDILTRSGFMQETGNDHQFMNIEDTVNFINATNIKVDDFQSHVFQYNERKFPFTQKMSKIFSSKRKN